MTTTPNLLRIAIQCWLLQGNLLHMKIVINITTWHLRNENRLHYEYFHKGNNY